jgi:uncharacterized protein YbjT (DUF2867 family)
VDDVEVRMTPTRVAPVLVTGATGRVGRLVIDRLIDAGVPVRAFTHRSEAAATLPATVDVVTGDLTIPDSLEAGLQGVGAVFLVWTAPPTTAAAVVERLATHAPRVVVLSSPHQTPHPFFQQPNPMAVLHAEIERLIAAAGLASTIIRPGMLASNAGGGWTPAIRGDGVVRWPYGAAETAGRWPRSVVDMLLAAWGATLERPAYITSTVCNILGSAPRSFRQWVADHATAFREGPVRDHA